MRDLYLLNYNNYNNRIVKREPGLLSYENYLCADIVRGVNFVPGNGINTQVTINSKYIDVSGMVPDYLLVIEEGIIESRWFVLDVTRTANGQHKLKLKRDTVADYLDTLVDKNSIFNIQRGWVKEDDPAIYNSEGFSFNEIKKEEILLKDYTEMPWIVGYISPDVASRTEMLVADVEGYYDGGYTSLEQYPFYKYIDKKIQKPGEIQVTIRITNESNYKKVEKLILEPYYSSVETLTTADSSVQLTAREWSAINNMKSRWSANDLRTSTARQAITNTAKDLGAVVVNENELANIMNQHGRRFKVNGDIYEVNVTQAALTVYGSVTIGSSLDRIIQEVCYKPGTMTLWDGLTSNYGGVKAYPKQVVGPNQIQVQGQPYILTVRKIGPDTSTSIKFGYKFTGVDISNPETPYGIICMPYEDGWNIGNEELGLSKEARLKIFQALGSVQGLLYDIQLLPYCPIRNLLIDKVHKKINTIGNTKRIDVNKGVEIDDKGVVTNPGTYATSFIVANKASCSFNIAQSIKLNNIKIQNETEKWRLCSPNYSGVFDFNVAKFQKDISFFKVDVNFKPYNPYIHVAPQWSGLYGKDFGDARGLICGGDWSIDRISDNWETYQLNNKNFQLQFDRQVETMELQKTWGMRSATAQGIINGVSSAAMAGIWGGALGVGLGAATGVIDTIYNTTEQRVLGQDTINAAKDQFKWQLGNIQAQPYGLTKVSALNNNNKLFPFIEHYTSTEEEVKFLNNYINEQGMAVNRVSDLMSYYKQGGFIVAGLIKAPKFKGSAMMLTDITNELLQGVHLYAD